MCTACLMDSCILNRSGNSVSAFDSTNWSLLSPFNSVIAEYSHVLPPGVESHNEHNDWS